MSENRKRAYRVVVHFDEQELKQLNDSVQRTGYPREVYIRSILNGNVPAERPSDDFLEVIHQLRMIGNNINQVAVVANRTGSIDILKFNQALEYLNQNIVEIREMVYIPQKIQ